MMVDTEVRDAEGVTWFTTSAIESVPLVSV